MGVKFGYLADIFASFEAPAFWVRKLSQNWMVWNPNAFGEGSVTGELTFVTPMVDTIMRLHFIGLKLAPLDLALAWDLDRKSTRCRSISFFTEVLDLQFELEFYVRECSVGLLGYFLKETDGVDWYNC